MIKKLGIGCLGLIGLVFVLGIFSAIGGGGATKANPTPSTAATPASGSKATDPAKAASPAATEAAKVAAKATEGPRLGSSRTAPVPFGQPIALTQGDKTFEVGCWRCRGTRRQW